MPQGTPCWYELTTGDITTSQTFYGSLSGWTYQDAGMEGFDYRLAMAGEAMVAGLYAPFEGQPEAWLVYFEAEDLDASLARATELGATILQPANDVPETGRFAVLADPQGAVFGLFQMLPGEPSQAYGPMLPGHGCWHELSCHDPQAALAFYAEVLGWRASTVMPMGDMGDYRLFAGAEGDIGGMMPSQRAGVPPHWLPYFGIPSASAAAAQIAASGGIVTHGPIPVPGGAFAVMAQDPRGAHFGLVGGA
ncbi:MAG TPA: VOC family protein [Gemmobacter sp.]|nr:VOC family protein [Gemmobacter sp.]